MAVLMSVLLVSGALTYLHEAPRGSSIAFLQDEPEANAGENVTVYTDDIVILNGSGSTGFEGAENLNYTWDVLYETHTNTTYGMVVELTFPREGVASVNLTVRDSLNRTSWDIVIVFINEPPPTFLDQYLMTIVILAIISVILLYLAVFVAMRLRAHQPVVSDARKEKMVLGSHRYWGIFKKVFKNPMGFLGIVILTFPPLTTYTTVDG